MNKKLDDGKSLHNTPKQTQHRPYYHKQLKYIQSNCGGKEEIKTAI